MNALLRIMSNQFPHQAGPENDFYYKNHKYEK